MKVNPGKVIRFFGVVLSYDALLICGLFFIIKLPMASTIGPVGAIFILLGFEFLSALFPALLLLYMFGDYK